MSNMVYIKFILLIIFALLTQIASAQYYGCSLDNFKIRHYACAEKVETSSFSHVENLMTCYIKTGVDLIP